ncbi:MAG: SPFH domain-containing protein [Pyrinomonadaceae bacterium]|nr:SPFH domain-containing protein [Phycisphaerales bacterium]
MAIWDRLKKELIDIVEFIDDTNNTLVHRFPRFQNEIKNGAKLVVREGQAAVFVKEGQIADVKGPGLYTLDTNNVPILATLLGWKYGFESPFKAEVYFVSTRRFTDQKWGTSNPVICRDKEFGPIRLRAFGSYVFKIKDPGRFIKEVAGTDGNFTVEDINAQLRNNIVARLGDVMGESGIPVLDMSANYDELGKFLTGRIAPEFESMGVELTQLLLENISLPPEVEQALDTRTKMGVIGDLNNYTKFKAADALEAAAKNPGGAGQFVGLGVGMNMAGMIGGNLAGAQAAGNMPPSIPMETQFHIAVNNQQTGPFPVTALRDQVSSGNLTRETLAWKPGMAGWAKAGTIIELQGLFASVPPPMPPMPPQ